MKALILAGGKGSRLWPLSRDTVPKQFLDLDGRGSLLLQTLRRYDGIPEVDSLFVITNQNHYSRVNSLVHAFNPLMADNVVLEPVGRNTAPAILLAAKFMEERAGAGLGDVMLVLPSDHYLHERANCPTLRQLLALGERLARDGKIVTFGIEPHYPETGYGYIKAFTGEADSLAFGLRALPVSRFTEKPDANTATRYLAEGGYYWNAGMFAFSLETFYAELRRHAPALAPYLSLDFDTLMAEFAEMPDISIDYAVMEHTDRAVVIPMAVQWSDIGSWDSLYDALDKNPSENVAQGRVIALGTRESLLINKTDTPMAVVDLEGVIVVNTPDGLLLVNRGSSQKVRDIVGRLAEFEPAAPNREESARETQPA